MPPAFLSLKEAEIFKTLSIGVWQDGQARFHNRDLSDPAAMQS